MSKSLATIATQPLIVAKVGLQSKPPPARNGRPFTSFVEVMKFIIEHEGAVGLFKGIAPQILKGLLVQGILMMTKERCVKHICPPATLRSNHMTVLQGGAHVCPPASLPQVRTPPSAEYCSAGFRSGRSKCSSRSSCGASEVDKLNKDT